MKRVFFGLLFLAAAAVGLADDWSTSASQSGVITPGTTPTSGGTDGGILFQKNSKVSNGTGLTTNGSGSLVATGGATFGTPLGLSSGGTGVSSFNANSIIIANTNTLTDSGSMSNGQLLIGNGLGLPTLGTITGTANRVTVANGQGSITLSGPQDLATTSTPTFASLITGGNGTSTIQTTGSQLNFVVGPSTYTLNQNVGTSSAAITVAGNAFNAANDLVQLDSSGNYPNNSGVNIAGIPQLASTQTFSATQTMKWAVVTTSAVVQGTGGSGTVAMFAVGNGVSPTTFSVLSNGNVGFGVATPTANIDVRGTNAIIKTTDTAVVNVFEASSSGSAGIIGTTSNHALAFQTNGSNKAGILANGNFGIGTTNPGALLDVQGTGAVIRATDTAVAIIMEALSSSSLGQIGTTSNHALAFMTNNTLQGGILGSGNWGVGTTNPGVKLDVVGQGRFSTGVYASTQADSAAAGNVGEYISTGSTVFANMAGTGTFGNVVSGPLTSGNWIVSGCVTVKLNGSTMTDYEIAVSSFSANTTTDHVEADNWIESAALPLATSNSSACVSGYRLTLAGTTTIYLKAKGAFSVATPQVVGVLKGYRPR